MLEIELYWNLIAILTSTLTRFETQSFRLFPQPTNHYTTDNMKM